MRIIRHPQLLCVAAGLVFVAMQILEFAYFRPLAGGLPQLDYRTFGFSTDEASDWLTALGPAGAQAMLVWHYLTFDLVFPALFGLALASLTLMAARRVKPFAALPPRLRTRLALLWVAPYVAVDYLQNLFVARMLSDPTALDHTLVEFASGLVVAKFVFGAIGIAVLVLLVTRGRTTHPGDRP